MKFITRELYDLLQSEAPPKYARGEWLRASTELKEHTDSIASELLDSVREFMLASMHDGIVKRVDLSPVGRLTIEIDGSALAWHDPGQYQVVFHGVKISRRYRQDRRRLLAL